MRSGDFPRPPWRWVLCFMLVVWSGFAAEEEKLGFPAAGCVVVLLTGLPGDIDSQKTYEEQMNSWLKFLSQSSSPPRAVYALTDGQEPVRSPGNITIQQLASRRDQVLELSRKLSGQTNPIVIVIWGHGGMQGTIPVFHVRGPRLTASDFQAFASNLQSAEQNWILLFRGSGQFARALAAPKRRIISSEGETVSGSDPIAMGILLEQLQSKSAAKFEGLAVALGRGVADWYDTRHLARTEDPILWAFDHEPKRLANAGQEDAGAVESTPNPVRGAASAAVEAPAPADLRPRAAVERSNSDSGASSLGPEWAEVGRVDGQKYLGSDAVILRRVVKCTLGTSIAVSIDHEEFIQILTADGKQYGDFDIEHSPDEEMKFVDCEVLLKDGKLVRLPPDAILDRREAAAGDYPSVQRKFFSLPGVGPGAVIHVRYAREWKKFPLPYISLEIPGAADIPVRNATMTLAVAKESALHFKWENVAAPDPELKQANYSTTYIWHFDELPPRAREPLTPSSWEPRLLISTFPDWGAFSDWYGRITKLADTITPEIAAQSAELTRGAKSDDEKVSALYDFVAGLRYVMIPLGVNSHRPHAAANVLRNRFGDCKDKANLFNTLLRAAGIEAHLVLVPRFTQAYEGLPGLAFNHAISQVILDGKAVWVDTTDDVCRFGMLPPGDPGRNVLVIDAKTSALTRLPEPRPNDHRLRMTTEIQLGRSPEPAAEVNAVSAGFPDYEFRLLARDAKAHGAGVPLIALKFRPVAGVFVLDKQRWTDVSALSESFSWKANGTWIGAVLSSNGTYQVAPAMWLPREWDAALGPRTAPLFLERGYPLVLEEFVDFVLPARPKKLSLPPSASRRDGPLRWSVDWSCPDPKRLRAALRLELAHGELTLAETNPFQAALRELYAACAASARFEIAAADRAQK